MLLPAALALDGLPASWEVTSDSIAAWVAGKAGAGRLVLVKEVDGLFAQWPAHGDPIARMTAAELAALRPAGVDEHLPTLLERATLRDVGDQRARPRAPRRAARTRRDGGHARSPERACYRGAMDAQQRPSTRGATLADPTLREYKLVGGLETFANRSFWPGFFSRVAARKQWDAAAIDFAPDARAWEELPDERRQRLTTLLAGFRVGEDAVAEHLTPFVAAANRETLASQESLMAWTFTLQRRDEERHARFFDRIAAEVLRLPGETPAERRAAAREYATPEILELFEEQLPTLAAELAAGEAGLGDGVSLYHMLLEGVVFNAGTTALLDDLADGALPGVREGVERVERDERWHVGFGLRCLIETLPSQERIDDLVARGVAAAAAWGDAVPAAIREHSARTCAHRLHVSGFTETRAA